MADPQQPDSGNDFPDSSDNSNFGEESLAPKSQSDDTKAETKESTQKNESTPQNITVNVVSNNDDRPIVEAQRANRFTKIGLYINGFLLACTLGALLFTWWSLNDARKKDIVQEIRDRILDSTNRAKDSMSYIRDTTTYNLAKKDMEQRSKRDNASLDLTKKSIDAQIKTINVTQAQFDSANQPLLQIGEITYLLNTLEAPVIMKYKIKNLSPVPVKILYARTAFKIIKSYSTDNSEPILKELIGKLESDKLQINLYSTQENPAEVKTYSRYLSDSEFSGLRNKNNPSFIFFYEEIRYKNIVTGRDKIYAFLIRINGSGEFTYPNGITYDLLYTDNYYAPTIK